MTDPPHFVLLCELSSVGNRMTLARDVALLVGNPDRNMAAELDTDVSAQPFGTEGIPPLARPSILARFFMSTVAAIEKSNLKRSRFGNPPVYANSTFPWVAQIERGWPAIRRELEQVLARQAELPPFQEISPDVATITKDAGWKTFILAGYGLQAEANIRRCPETWKIVQCVPGLKTAMFSIFEPGKHLPAHRGPYNGVLRFHLGLIVPRAADKVAIRVHDQVCHWAEGRALLFDDAYEHEAWNHSDETRVVLFIDFVRPLRFPANLFNWLVLNLAVFTPFIREGVDNHREWERRFYRA